MLATAQTLRDSGQRALTTPRYAQAAAALLHGLPTANVHRVVRLQDVLIGSKVVASTSETLRKFRNTARFLLGNLDDYRPLTMGLSFPDVDVSNSASEGDLTQKLQAMWGTCPSDGLSSHPSLHAVDVYMLTRLAALNTHVQAAFSTFNYSKVCGLCGVVVFIVKPCDATWLTVGARRCNCSTTS